MVSESSEMSIVLFLTFILGICWQLFGETLGFKWIWLLILPLGFAFGGLLRWADKIINRKRRLTQNKEKTK